MSTPGRSPRAWRPIAIELGDALLDQSLVAGIGNIFKSEACFAAGVSPWRRTGELSRERVASTLEAARNLMLEAVRTGRRADGVYGRAGRPCPRCGTRILSRAQGDAARITYWCPKCQPEAG
jgi:endonuclease-8